jgi:uncharacterized protein
MLIIAIILFAFYLKNAFLYHPIKSTDEKYQIFYHKLGNLIDSSNDLHHFNIHTDKGYQLDTVYVKNPNSDKYVMFLHGNSGNITMRYDMIKFLYNYASVVIFDYHAFGMSTGDQWSLFRDGLYHDAKTVWNFMIHKLEINPSAISLFGESLGCAIAIHLAAEISSQMDSIYYPHSLILNSPFYSLSSMIEMIFEKNNMVCMGGLISYLFGNEYRSNYWIKYLNHRTKIIVAHSPLDEIIPYRQGVDLYDSIRRLNNTVKFINIAGTHNNFGLTDDYIYALADLFDD